MDEIEEGWRSRLQAEEVLSAKRRLQDATRVPRGRDGACVRTDADPTLNFPTTTIYAGYPLPLSYVGCSIGLRILNIDISNQLEADLGFNSRRFDMDAAWFGHGTLTCG